MALVKQYLKHDIDAHENPKLIELWMETGFEGIGIYWTFSEIFAQNGGHLTEKELKVMAFKQQVTFEKLMQILNIVGVKTDKEGYYIERVLEDIQTLNAYSKKQQENANKRWKKEKHVAPVPEWHEKYEKDKEKQREQEKKEEEIKKKVSDKINKKYPDYINLMAKSLTDETTPEEKIIMKKISEEQEEMLEKELSKIKKNPFQE